MEFEAFVRHWRATFSDQDGSTIVIALSGGADSTALLHLLHRSDFRLTLHAVHVHHGTRGREADADAHFCRDLCDTLGIPFSEIRLTDTSRSDNEATTAPLRGITCR